MVVKHLGETLTIILGISSGILTLVGLIAVFVSINSQHNIQKCRELLWDIRSSSIFGDLSDAKILKDLLEKLWLYGDLLKGGDRITNVTVRLAKITILLVVLIWISVLVYIKNNIVHIEYLYILVVTILGILVMLSFYYLLSLLKKFNKLSGLPTFDELMDCHNRYINTLAIAAHTCKIQVAKSNQNPDRYVYILNFPNDFKNINISISSAYFLDKQNQQLKEIQDLQETHWGYIPNLILDFYIREWVSRYNISSIFENLIPEEDEYLQVVDSIVFAIYMKRNSGRQTRGIDAIFKLQLPISGGTLKPDFCVDLDSADYINNENNIEDNSTIPFFKYLKKIKGKRLREKLPPKLRRSDFEITSILKMTEDEVKSLNYMTSELYSELQSFLEVEGLKLKSSENVGNMLLRNFNKNFYKKIFIKRSTMIEDMNFSTRTYNCLKRHGINNLGQLSKIKQSELKQIKNLGKGSYDEIVSRLQDLGIKLKE